MLDTNGSDKQGRERAATGVGGEMGRNCLKDEIEVAVVVSNCMRARRGFEVEVNYVVGEAARVLDACLACVSLPTMTQPLFPHQNEGHRPNFFHPPGVRLQEVHSLNIDRDTAICGIDNKHSVRPISHLHC